MKKEWLGLAMLTLTIAGCSQNEVTEINPISNKKNEISFDLSTEKTRVTDATLGSMQLDADGFMVFGTQNLEGNEVLVNNQKYHYDTSAWKWKDLTGDMTPKWPTNSDYYPVNFYAYYPHNILESNPLAKKDLAKEIKVKSVADQIDILVAAQRNIMMKPASSRIAFTFEHILSKISFKADVVQSAVAYIQAISVNKVKDTRTFDFQNSDWSGDATNQESYIFRASPTTGNSQVTISGGSSQTIIGDGNNAAMMLMPQSHADRWTPVLNTTADAINQCITELGTKANIQMIYRMISGANDIVGYSDATKYPDWETFDYAKNHSNYKGGLYIKVAYSLGVDSWLKGKSYTYEFKLGTLGATGGYLIDDTFYDDNGVDTEVPVRHPGSGGGVINPGNPPFETGGNIDFDIIVKDWDTTHGNANNPLN